MAQPSKIDSITECESNVMWLKVMVSTRTISLLTEDKICVVQRFEQLVKRK